MPAAQLMLAANEGMFATTSSPSAKSSRSKRADDGVQELQDVDGLEDGTIETGSAPAARARAAELRRARDTLPEADAPRSRSAAQLVIGALLAFAIGAFVVTQWIFPLESDAPPTTPVDVAVKPVDVHVVAPPVAQADAGVKEAIVVEPVVVKKNVKPVKKPSKPPKGALPGVVIRYLEQRCPTLPCARKLIAHKGDWVDLPITQLRTDLDQCVARCEK